MADNKDTKNYQKTQSRSSSKTTKTTGNIAIQSIKYLVMNPLAVNYRLSQSYITTGATDAKQSYSY